MLYRLKILLILFLLNASFVQGQVKLSEKDILDYSKLSFTNTDSGIVVSHKLVGVCRLKINNSFLIPFLSAEVTLEENLIETKIEKEKFLTIHGNVTYFLNYRSYIDTPFAENNVIQHTIQTRLDMVLKEKYPFTVYLTSRRSNSDFFSNATDVSFQFHQTQMLENIKRDKRIEIDNFLSNKSLTYTPIQLYQKEKAGELKNIGNFSSVLVKGKINDLIKSKQKEIEEKYENLYEDYKKKVEKLEAIKPNLNLNAGAQGLVEEKERVLRGVTNKIKDSIQNIAGNFIKKTLDNTSIANELDIANKKVEEKKKEVEKLKKEVVQAEQKLKLYQKAITDSLQKLKRMITSITNKNKLDDFLHETGSSIKELPALQRLLLSVKQIGLGRSWIDYSELTVKNISLSGVNIEMNPSNIYFAAAAGKVNYRFRDYILKGNYAGSNQSVGLVRAGFGKKERSNIILTYYVGQKALLAQTSTSDALTQKIAGFSLETRKNIDQHNYIIGEYARSTSAKLKSKTFDFSNNTNEAFSLKLFSDYGNTKLNGYYRKTGEDFQSFTLFPTNNKQDAWMMRATQKIWKKRILLDAAIRKNDFNSPIATPNFSNTNVFKSFQATVRVPKYPFVSAGYYPSSQLTLSDNNVLYENRYNTFNAIISHSYFLKNISMNTNATFTKFYNSGSDIGFIYYNASTLTINHTVKIEPFILQGIVTITDQSFLKQTTIEPVVTYQFKNKLSLSGSAKWNRINHTETLWGGTAGLNLYLKKIGVLQVQYDKIYLPGYSRNLLPVDIGRVMFSREF